MKINPIAFMFFACMISLALAANEAYSSNEASSSAGLNTELTQALNSYLATQGDLCVGKFDWPIDVTLDEAAAMNTRDAVQMPVLEKLGLVTVSNSMTTRMIDEKDITLPAKRYTLTEKGQKYYLKKHTTGLAAGKQIVHEHDLCAGKLSLDKITHLEPGANRDKMIADEVTVSYTYKIAPSEWAAKPEAQRVFPMVAQIINGQGTLQLQQVFHRGNSGWEATNPWK